MSPNTDSLNSHLPHWTVMCAAVAVVIVGLTPKYATAKDEPFKPHPVPQWMLKDFRPCFEWTDTDEGLKKLLDSGANALFNAPSAPWWLDDKGFYDLIDSKKVYVDMAKRRAAVERVQKAGIKAFGGMSPMWGAQEMAEHPDWQWLTKPDAKPNMDFMKSWPLPQGCWYSPFGDYYIKKDVRMARELGLDGQILDGFGGAYTACYCTHCRDGYRKATGKQIPALEMYPAPPNVNDPEYRHYIKWRIDEYNKYVARWMKALKGVKPDYAFVPWTTGPGRSWHWHYAPLVEHGEDANRIVDAPMLELFWDFAPDQASNLLPSFTVRYYRGITRENPAIMCIYFRSQGQQNASPPRVENDFRIYTVMTNGGVPFLIDYVQDDVTKPKEYWDEIKARQPYTDETKSVKWAAMLVSENSRILYGIAATHGELKGGVVGSGVDTPDASKLPPGERRIPGHLESSLGLFRAAEEDHLPLDIITDRDLEDPDYLAQYKVIALPNAACLSDKSVSNLRKYVENGGGLVAMHETSLYNEFGDKRKDFAMSDLFGASFTSVEDHTARWPEYSRPTVVKFSAHEITNDPVIQGNLQMGSDNIDYIGMTTQVTASADVEVIGKRLGEKEPPFLLLSKHGKGRVAYIAADTGQSYFTNPYQYERKVMTNSLRWVAVEAPPVRVTAPMCVQATFYQQGGGKRTIVHLLNEINSTSNRALPEGDPPMREEIVPLSGIKVFFADALIKRVHLEPEGQDLPIAKVSGGIEVSVPTLGLHSMVVADK